MVAIKKKTKKNKKKNRHSLLWKESVQRIDVEESTHPKWVNGELLIGGFHQVFFFFFLHYENMPIQIY